MSANKPNIEQIRKYLNGELNARAMFELERQANEDPFLWDVMKGMERSDENHKPNLINIDELIKARVKKDKKRIVPMWRYLPVAASLLIALGIGGWWLTREPAKTTVAVNKAEIIYPDKVKVETALADTQPITVHDKMPLMAKRYSSKPAPLTNKEAARATNATVAALGTLNADTVEYKASAFLVKPDMAANGLLKKLPGVVVDSNGNVSSQGRALTRVRLNGKDFFGGDVKSATKNLPAELIAKIQTVDDYGDQAAKQGVKIDTKALANLGDGQLKEVKIKAGDSPKTVTGKIFDKDNKAPLPGVMVKIEGTKSVTMTDGDGVFKINVPGENATLYVAYLGYAGQQVKVKDKDKLDIALAPDNKSLSEVVVTGYGTAKEDQENEDAHPAIGWEAYDKYLKENTKVTDGKTGVVKVTFTLRYGTMSNINVVKGLTDALNKKAVELIQNGSRWLPEGDGESRTVTVRIKFHK